MSSSLSDQDLAARSYCYSVVNSSGGDSVKLGENIIEGFKVVIKKLIQQLNQQRLIREILREYHREIHNDTKIVNRIVTFKYIRKKS